MRFAIFITLLAFLKVALGQQWETSTLNKYTSLLGVYARTSSEIHCSIMDNAVGNGVLVSNDYATTGSFYGPVGGMNMGIAVSGDDSTVCMVGVGGIFMGPPSSADLSKVANIRLISQSVEPIGQTGFGVTGQFAVGRTDTNGVSVTSDGTTWTQSDIGTDSALYPARYGSFPSENTWFVSAGTWPMDASAGLGRRITARVAVNDEQKQLSYNYTPKNLRDNLRSNKKVKTSDPTGYTGAVAKTTDGGKTWSTVFTTDQFYFNQINCHCEKHCIAVGENDDTAFAVYTEDGGATWSTVFTGPPGLSLVATRMLSGKEAWISGGLQQRGGALMGYYYHTTDAGANWTTYTSNGYSFDMSFKDGVGYAAFMTQSYSSVAVYNKGN
jgi:hypothetical protein